MKKGFLFTTIMLAAIMALSSCKRHWRCTCNYTGELDSTITRELWDYNKKGAEQVCSAEEYYSTSSLKITCNVH